MLGWAFALWDWVSSADIIYFLTVHFWYVVSLNFNGNTTVTSKECFTAVMFGPVCLNLKHELGQIRNSFAANTESTATQPAPLPAFNALSSHLCSQVTVVTSRPGRGIVHQLEMGLKDADLVSLKRLLVVQICGAAGWGPDSPSPEATHAETEGRKEKYGTSRHENQRLRGQTVG